ncbi:MAG TPA: hypothetical protein VFJ51_03970 [Nitrososphaeraceae archaeon]|nr:hypothetical protein [Nitrososphaeraceae archaeon]
MTDITDTTASNTTASNTTQYTSTLGNIQFLGYSSSIMRVAT